MFRDKRLQIHGCPKPCKLLDLACSEAVQSKMVQNVLGLKEVSGGIQREGLF